MGNLERWAGSMGLRGTLGLFSATGWEAEARGEDTVETFEGVGLVILRWEALCWLAGASPLAGRDAQQPYDLVSEG